MSSSNRVIRKKKCKKKVSFLKLALHNMSRKSLSHSTINIQKDNTLKLYIEEVKRLTADNTKLTAEKVKLTAENAKLAAEIFSLKIEMEEINALRNEDQSLRDELDKNKLFHEISTDDEDESGTDEYNNKVLEENSETEDESDNREPPTKLQKTH